MAATPLADLVPSRDGAWWMWMWMAGRLSSLRLQHLIFLVIAASRVWTLDTGPLIRDSYLRSPLLHTYSVVQTHLFSRTLLCSPTFAMASESRLYTFSGATKEHLRKFRLTTSRAKGPQAVIYMIDKHTYEIRQDEDQTVYTSLDDIGEDLPDHSPRFVLLSYPTTKPDGRVSVPYVLLYYLPITCNAEARMMYAGAKELMRNTSEVGSVIDLESAEDLEEIPKKLGAE
ncbi:hypothetical protein G7046_g2439 [Stylonectria norvegica]|nr:hypothetical protein G7046_g2439 [Stylonectria norvegica]